MKTISFLIRLCLFLLTSFVVQAYQPSSLPAHRRQVLQNAFVTAGIVFFGPQQEAAWASGGATAGKYTTIPIAKRRYYGRVQQAVHELLLMAPAIAAGNLAAEEVQHFFDEEGTVIMESKRSDIRGQCTKKDKDCRAREIRDSRFNDMKTSMYLLGNAFRINQTKPPDNLPTVKAAKAFFKDMNDVEKLVKKNPEKNADQVKAKYASALKNLEVYLDLVELPPTDSGNYDREFDTLVGEAARIT